MLNADTSKTMIILDENIFKMSLTSLVRIIVLTPHLEMFVMKEVLKYNVTFFEIEM